MQKWNIKNFEELSLKELYEIARSRCEVFIKEQMITSEEDLDGIDDKCIHVFLKEEERVIAYCRIIPSGIKYEYVSIGRVLVVSEFRKKGIAKEMLEICLKYIKNNLQGNKIVLSAQLYAKNLYSSVGFVECSEVFDEACIPHIKMKLNIGCR